MRSAAVAAAAAVLILLVLATESLPAFAESKGAGRKAKKEAREEAEKEAKKEAKEAAKKAAKKEEKQIQVLLRKRSLRTRTFKSKKGRVIDYRKAAGQKASTYRCFQGSTSNGKYSYHVLFYKKKNRCKIIKVDPKTKKVLRVSKGYKIYHGNDMTYDTKRDRLLVVHGDGDTKRVSVFDPKTLKKKKTVRIKLRGKIKGASRKYVSGIKGITDISYDERRDVFVCSIKKTLNFIELSSSLKPKRVIKVKHRHYMTKQGTMVAGKKILRAVTKFTGSGIKNYIYVYSLRGKYLRRIRIRTRYELESVYVIKGKLYASVFHENKRKHIKRSYIIRIVK